MRLINSVKITVFSKPEDDDAKIKTALLSILPFDLEKEKIQVKSSTASGFNERRITIYEVAFDKERLTNLFLKFLREKLTSEQKRYLCSQENRVDEDCHFFMRLDKAKLFEGEFWVTDCGDCYHVDMSLAAFPRKRECALDVAKKMFA